ncbi:hypothetical protein ACFLRH_01690 [Actinomycetota bacterium]
MSTNNMQEAFARLEAHRRELEAQIVFELEAKFLSTPERTSRIIASHRVSHAQASFDGEETTSGNDSHTTIGWVDDE